MKRIFRSEANAYDMSVREPMIRVDPSETFVIETEDTYNGLIKSENDVPTPDLLSQIGRVNPVGGPVYVNGAKKGDVLAVDIVDIVVDDQGATLLIPGEGLLRDSAKWPTCSGPYARIMKNFKEQGSGTPARHARFNNKITWQLSPLIGTIGVAPEDPIEAGCDSLIGQGSWGGNYDCRDIRKGTRVLFPVFNEGGLFFAGDVHASQGDGELTGEANETRAEVTLRCEVISGKKIPFPRLENERSIIQLNVDKPLEKAITQAFIWLIEWLVSDYGFEARDAYLMMSVDPHVRINVYQMVDIGRLRYTVGVEFPKEHL